MRPYTVLLCGGSPAEQRLAESLSRYGCVQRLRRGCISQSAGNSPDILLYEFDRIPEAVLPEGILLLGSRLSAERTALPPHLIPVFDSGNQTAARLLMQQQREGVSCGCAPQDTLSLASLSDTQAVVSLQRGLCTLDHQLLEPRDLTLQLSRPYELFELMALCAVLLLSGRFSDESLYFSRGR